MTKLAIAALLAGSAAAFTSSPAPKSTVALHETKVRSERPHFLSEMLAGSENLQATLFRAAVCVGIPMYVCTWGRMLESNMGCS